MSASDPDGTVTLIDLFEGSNHVGSATQAPAHITWTPDAAGVYSLHAVATDNSGASTSSAPVTVTISSGTTSGGPPTAPQGWFALSSGVNVDLQGVFFADANSGWAVGNSGTIIHSSDGGATWAAQNSGVTSFLSRVQFVSATRGWALGGNVLLSTSDGGAIWTRLSTPSAVALEGLSFVSATTGWVVGDQQTILKTTDGGATWVAQSGPEFGFDFHCVSFVDALHGWIGGDGFAQSTSDGGATWTRHTLIVPNNFGDPYMIGLVDARFMSQTTGTLVGGARDGGKIVTTTDGGASWTITTTNPPPEFVSGVAFGDAQHLWAVGPLGVFASTDKGVTWAPQSTPGVTPLRAVWFVDANQGWAVGLNGTILKTTTGGRGGS
jgi:photosystem II stability/assembly factor-like uncharacterized protein